MISNILPTQILSSQSANFAVSTVPVRYLQIPYLHIHLLAKIHTPTLKSMLPRFHGHLKIGLHKAEKHLCPLAHVSS